MDMNSDVIKDQAKEIFERAKRHYYAELEGGLLLRESIVDTSGIYDHFSKMNSESIQQHLISSVSLDLLDDWI
jgi:F420-0:gamma-glutamyl ligase